MTSGFCGSVNRKSKAPVLRDPADLMVWANQFAERVRQIRPSVAGTSETTALGPPDGQPYWYRYAFDYTDFAVEEKSLRLEMFEYDQPWKCHAAAIRRSEVWTAAAGLWTGRLHARTKNPDGTTFEDQETMLLPSLYDADEEFDYYYSNQIVANGGSGYKPRRALMLEVYDAGSTYDLDTLTAGAIEVFLCISVIR